MQPEQKKDSGVLQAPILVKVSLKRHSPQQIYDYVLKNVGELGMKIKKRQAIIGFENQKFYKKLIDQHQNIMLHGKKLQFKILQKADENFIMSQEQQIRQIVRSGETKIIYPEFVAKNNVEARAHFYRVQMLQKIHSLFEPTLESIRQRSQQLSLQYKQKGPYQREMISLEKVLQKKLQKIQQKYEADILSIQKYIQQISTKSDMVGLQPTFRYQEVWEFPKIQMNNMKMQFNSYYKNAERFPCKRLCAINGQQFAVTMSHPKEPQGYTKLFKVNSTDQKQSIPINHGAYAVCRVNNFLLIGSNDSKIKYLNLDDKDYVLNNSSTLSQPNIFTSFYQIQILKPFSQNIQIVALEGVPKNGNRIKIFSLSFDQIMADLTAVDFTHKQQIIDECRSFIVLSPQIIMYGGTGKIKKYHLQRKIAKQIQTKDTNIKLKKFNENLIAATSTRMVQLADLRSQSVVQTFPTMKKQMKSLEVLSDHSLMYGANQQIGLLDDRKPNQIPWQSEKQHQGLVYDILKLKNKVVSCDSSGGIYSWKVRQQSNPVIQVQFKSGSY